MFLQAQVCSLGPEYKSTAMFRLKNGTGDTQSPLAGEERSQLAAVMSQLTAAATAAAAGLLNQGA